MKGKVLGFDAAAGTGAITGDDGKRYAFALADNKSPAALKPGDAVDFQVDGDAAKDIYAVPGGANVDLAAMAANPAVANILAKPNVIWAALIILGSLIGGYFSTIELIGGGPMGVLGIGRLRPGAAGVRAGDRGRADLLRADQSSHDHAIPHDHGGSRDRRADPPADPGRHAARRRKRRLAGFGGMGAHRLPHRSRHDPRRGRRRADRADADGRREAAEQARLRLRRSAPGFGRRGCRNHMAP